MSSQVKKQRQKLAMFLVLVMLLSCLSVVFS